MCVCMMCALIIEKSSHSNYRCAFSIPVLILVNKGRMREKSSTQYLRQQTSSLLLKGLAASALVFTSKQPSLAIQKGADEVVQTLPNIKTTAEFIEKHCTKILKASKRTGRLLYRGRDSAKSSIKDQSSLVISESSDLLLPATYSSVIAAQYFIALDEYISKHPRAGLEYFQDNDQSTRTVAKPSNGHIATSIIEEAGKWGSVYSCWPIDDMHYTWLKSNKLFWKDSWGTFASDGILPPLFWRDASSLGLFCSKELIVDRDLEGVLEKGNEVMFTRTTTGNNDGGGIKGDYLLVPISQEGKLIRELGIEPYGAATNVKKLVTEVESDEVVSKVRRTKNGRMACTCASGRQYCSECVRKYNSDTSYKSTVSVFPLP